MTNARLGWWAVSAVSVMTLIGAGTILAQQPKPTKEAKPAVEDKATSGSLAAEVGKPAAKNPTSAPVATRQGRNSCDIHIDNRTQFVVHRVFIDGDYWGSIGRYGDAIARDVSTGRTKIYAEADFTDGTTRYWGPRWFACDSYSTYTWVIQ